MGYQPFGLFSHPLLSNFGICWTEIPKILGRCNDFCKPVAVLNTDDKYIKQVDPSKSVDTGAETQASGVEARARVGAIFLRCDVEHAEL